MNMYYLYDINKEKYDKMLDYVCKSCEMFYLVEPMVECEDFLIRRSFHPGSFVYFFAPKYGSHNNQFEDCNGSIINIGVVFHSNHTY